MWMRDGGGPEPGSRRGIGTDFGFSIFGNWDFGGKSKDMAGS